MEMEELARRLKEKRPNSEILSNIFAVLDGGRLPCAYYVNNNVQNRYYEGYKTSIEKSNFLAFNCKGELVHTAPNYPGSWQDSRVQHMFCLIHPKIYEDEITPREIAVPCDSALTVGRMVDDKIIWGRKANESRNFVSMKLSAIDLIMQQELKSERQSA